MTKRKHKWVEMTLINDEYSSDEELARFFLNEGISKEAVYVIMGQRNEALRNPFKFSLNMEGVLL
jgi:hypothetical protein